MNSYMYTPLGDRYRLVFYNGKKWCRVWSQGFWRPVGYGWTTVEHNRDVFAGVTMLR